MPAIKQRERVVFSVKVEEDDAAQSATLSDREHVYDVVHPGRHDGIGLLRTVDSSPGNLPHRWAPLVGRDGELHRLADDVRSAIW